MDIISISIAIHLILTIILIIMIIIEDELRKIIPCTKQHIRIDNWTSKLATIWTLTLIFITSGIIITDKSMRLALLFIVLVIGAILTVNKGVRTITGKLIKRRCSNEQQINRKS